MFLQPFLLVPILLIARIFLWALVRESPVSAVSYSQNGNKWHHNLYRYDDLSVRSLAEDGKPHFDDFNQTLDAILKPRVPGTEGHKQVREYLIKSLKDFGWTVEEDSFSAQTPVGRKPFSNVIASLNPKACRNLVLACHYDSKLSRENTFLGATDSAVPCAMLVHLARVLDGPLKSQKNKTNQLSLQLIFFDGEEAFKQWTSSDSLYGSRHLAEAWNRTPPTGKDCQKNGEEMISRLDQMEVLILLDLLGSASPQFYNFFPETKDVYGRLPAIENMLNTMDLIESHPPQSATKYFGSKRSWSFVEDDHIPFMQRGVPIIHLIPSPFPAVWHKESDNKENLHHPTICNLNKMMRVFVSEYLHLDPQKLNFK